MSAPKTYRIDRIHDLLAVPIERREACVRELLYALALLEFAAGTEAEPEAQAMVWTDDGDQTIDLSINGDQSLRLQVEGD